MYELTPAKQLLDCAVTQSYSNIKLFANHSVDKVKKLWCYRRFYKDYTSLISKSVRFPKPEIFVELF